MTLLSRGSVSLSALMVLAATGMAMSVTAQTTATDSQRVTALLEQRELEDRVGPGCVYGFSREGQLFARVPDQAKAAEGVALLQCPDIRVADAASWNRITNLHSANAKSGMRQAAAEGRGQSRSYATNLSDLRNLTRLETCIFAKGFQIPTDKVAANIRAFIDLAQRKGRDDDLVRAALHERIFLGVIEARRNAAVLAPRLCYASDDTPTVTVATAERASQQLATMPATPIVPPAPVAARRPVAQAAEATSAEQPPATIADSPGQIAGQDPAAPPRSSRGRPSRTGIPDAVWTAMQGKTWRPGIGCPARDELAYLRVPFFDFNGQWQTGEMIVADDVADQILTVFETLADARFPIQRMELVHNFDGNDVRSMDANNTSAFNCRRVTSGTRLSEHAFGRAIDINPVQNPYVRRGRTQPRAGRRYDSAAERLQDRLGVIRSNEVVTNAFAKIGWKWGGYWRSLKDYQHFSKSGR